MSTPQDPNKHPRSLATGRYIHAPGAETQPMSELGGEEAQASPFYVEDRVEAMSVYDQRLARALLRTDEEGEDDSEYTHAEEYTGWGPGDLPAGGVEPDLVRQVAADLADGVSYDGVAAQEWKVDLAQDADGRAQGVVVSLPSSYGEGSRISVPVTTEELTLGIGPDSDGLDAGMSYARALDAAMSSCAAGRRIEGWTSVGGTRVWISDDTDRGNQTLYDVYPGCYDADGSPLRPGAPWSDRHVRCTGPFGDWSYPIDHLRAKILNGDAEEL